MPTKAITKFDGTEYAFLSNFFAGKGGDVIIDHLHYPTTEHAFQAGKTFSIEARHGIASCGSPSEAKRLGRRLDMRDDWQEVKVGYMLDVLRVKFSNRDMAIRLMSTGDAELVEGNTWNDTYWGQCPVGNGKNVLGQLLMHVRKELQRGEERQRTVKLAFKGDI